MSKKYVDESPGSADILVLLMGIVGLVSLMVGVVIGFWIA